MNDVMVTSYCPYECCNEQWAGQTAVGIPIEKFLSAGYNICAVDPKVIPLWSIVEYQGIEYLAVDTGGKIRGRSVDILAHSHLQTIIFGRRYNQKIIIKGCCDAKCKNHIMF